MNMTASPFDMSGKTCIVTGANAGIGKRVALQLAESGAAVVMVARSRERGEAALAEVRSQSGNPAVALMLCDLSSQASIRRFADDFERKHQQLHVLINNAANFDHTLTRPAITEDGVETIFATNHLGPFLMTNLLLDTLKASAPSRVINVASQGLAVYPFLGIEFDNLNGERTFSTQHAYYHSKQAQVMFTYDLARRLEGTGVTVNCIRVTNVQIDHGRYEYLSGLKRSMYEIKRRFAMTPEEMAKTYVYLAASPEVESATGKYFDENRRQVRSNRKSYDESTWRRLWDVSAELTGLKETAPASAL